MFTLGSFASFLSRMAVEKVAEQAGLEKAAKIVEAEAKRVIGTYDYGWPQLAESTIARKANGNTPLLETGEMRDSIQHRVEIGHAFIGSDNDKAIWQELGTGRIPARSFLAGAAMHKGKEVAHVIGQEVFNHMIGGRH